MIPTPGDNAHVADVIKRYLAFTEAVRLLVPDLSVDHAGDIAARLAEIDPCLVREPDRLPAALKTLRADDPVLFQRELLGQHLARVLIAARPGQDMGSLRAAVDRMQAQDKRRCGYHAIKNLLAEGKQVPPPRDGDTNVACAPPGTASMTPHRRHRAQSGEIGGGQHDAAPVDVEDRDAQRGHLALQPMKRQPNRA